MKACKDHLVAAAALGTEVESYLVAFLLVTIVSEFEQRLEAIVAKRAERLGDKQVHSFVQGAVHRLLRSPKVSDISGFLKLFGRECQEEFTNMVSGTPGETSYGNIIVNRNSIAHSTIAAMTFADLEVAYQQAVKIVEGFAHAVGLTAVELADFGAAPPSTQPPPGP